MSFAEMQQLAQGALLEPHATWEKAKAEGRSALQMAKVLTIPLVLLCAGVSVVLGLLFERYVSNSLIIGQALFSAAIAILGVFLIAFLADYLAGAFGGERDYNAAFNAAALSGVPSALGSAVVHVPIIGPLTSLGFGLYGLYLLYGALPVFMKIPAEKRVVHFLATIGSAMAVGYLLGWIVRV